MSLDLAEIAALSPQELETKARENPAWFKEVERLFSLAATEDQKEVQLHYFTPSNPMALPAHLSTARELVLCGGNRSTKTTTALVELAIRATGHIPASLLDIYPLEKLHGPIRARIVCASLTDTLEPVIKPKLQWDHWNGRGDPGSIGPNGLPQGHWGLIPRHCLHTGTWAGAYQEKYRILKTVFCTLCPVMAHTDRPCRGCDAGLPKTLDGRRHRWPDSWGGISTIQMTSYDQDVAAFSGSSMHLVLHDELPPSDIYRENQLRVLDVRGQIITAFTPPDEAGANRADVSWFFDYVYEPGLPGPSKHPHIDTFNLLTEKNGALNAQDIEDLSERLTEQQREARLYGRFVHLSGVIFSLFTRVESMWCFRCGKRAMTQDGRCLTCSGDNTTEFTHVIEPFPLPATWPILFVIDPHPRKPDALGWFAVTPSDDLMMVGNLEAEGTAKDVAKVVREYEEIHHFAVSRRLMDPNMATETNDKQQRGWTMRRGYDAEGLRCDLANDEMTAGIQTVMEYLKPDTISRRPRLTFFSTCARAIQGMSRWSWDEWTRQGDREPKERVSERHKDHADLVRYAVMDRPSFSGYRMSGTFEHKRSRRRG